MLVLLMPMVLGVGRPKQIFQRDSLHYYCGKLIPNIRTFSYKKSHFTALILTVIGTCLTHISY